MNKIFDQLLTNSNGFDQEGRIRAGFGTPVVDGEIDAVWENAPAIVPKHISGDAEASAVFKVLWDDSALYILAAVCISFRFFQGRQPHRSFQCRLQPHLQLYLQVHLQ